ncbi:uncharacterized protein TRUGW13939_07350 [Talaromyces rugulosus]|uniref:AB hydrolase-1 domain-containing protein n=1 Tax=Talaromyces rugulosus TaxID=121627 RepID=A0A7H8R1W1_TALRU|nr:uncharacterized protein TRUGW13939_07350 [Talaromyces rugulosus]QKX60207.1 hypothetical protein TRUGW13939_07350 [Talaromyces rugulosus]
MEPFKITLSNEATLTGLVNAGSGPAILPNRLPLIVCLHGGTYTSRYFHVDASHTASSVSNSLGVPLVAINRPGYADSTSFYPIPQGSSYPQEYGIWLHRYILPAIWAEFGEPRGCNCIVLHCHSLGSTGAIIAASMHAASEPIEATYPLAGLVISGFGSQPSGEAYKPQGDETTITFPPKVKDSIMLQQGCADSSIYQYTEELNHGMPVEEIGDVHTAWFPRWKEWAGNVKAPVMAAVAQDDVMWKGTREHINDFGSAFTGSERVDTSVVIGAPHNMEMSYWATGWYTRSFGFALECAASFAHKNQSST